MVPTWQKIAKRTHKYLCENNGGGGAGGISPKPVGEGGVQQPATTNNPGEGERREGTNSTIALGGGGVRPSGSKDTTHKRHRV